MPRSVINHMSTIGHQSYFHSWSLIILRDGSLIIFKLSTILTPFLFDSFDIYVTKRKYIIILYKVVYAYVIRIFYNHYNCTFQSILSAIFLRYLDHNSLNNIYSINYLHEIIETKDLSVSDVLFVNSWWFNHTFIVDLHRITY